MAHILHILTRPSDSLAEELIARQKASGHEITAIDLTEKDPDYEELVNHIFQADSIQTW